MVSRPSLAQRRIHSVRGVPSIWNRLFFWKSLYWKIIWNIEITLYQKAWKSSRNVSCRGLVEWEATTPSPGHAWFVVRKRMLFAISFCLSTCVNRWNEMNADIPFMHPLVLLCITLVWTLTTVIIFVKLQRVSSLHFESTVNFCAVIDSYTNVEGLPANYKQQIKVLHNIRIYIKYEDEMEKRLCPLLSICS